MVASAATALALLAPFLGGGSAKWRSVALVGSAAASSSSKLSSRRTTLTSSAVRLV
jgi:hypothetical protein